MRHKAKTPMDHLNTEKPDDVLADLEAKHGSRAAHGSVADQWQPMSTAPKNCTHVQVRMRDGTIHDDAHWASDLSGEEQPPFEGWFRPVKRSDGRVSYYAGISEPCQWRPMPPNEKGQR